MKARLIRFVVAGGSVAAAGVLFAGTAGAHGAPYAVTAGSAPTGTAVAATAYSSGTVTFKDKTTNLTITCTVAVVKGSVTVGSSNGNPIATVNGAGAVFSNANGAPCTGPGGWQFRITGFGTWNIVATDTTSGVTTGTITNIRAHLVITAGPACAFDVGANSSTTGFASSGGSTSTVPPGEQGASFGNSTQRVTVSPSESSLGLWNVNPAAINHNCVTNSILKQGDSASFVGTFSVNADTAAYNPIAIN